MLELLELDDGLNQKMLNDIQTLRFANHSLEDL